MPRRASRPLLDGFAGLPPVREALAAVEAGGAYALGGLVGGSPSCLVASLADRLGRPVLIVTPGPEEAHVVHDDLAQFLGDPDDVAAFPAFDAARVENRAHETSVIAARLRVVEGAVTGRGARFVVASLRAVLQPVPAEGVLHGARLRVEVGERLDLGELAARLVEAGLARVPLAEAPGEFALRGGIADVYARGSDLPVRFELFGDEVESIRNFDPETQRSVEALDTCNLALVRPENAVGLEPAKDDRGHKRALQRARLLIEVLPPEATLVHVDETAAAQWLARFERSRPQEDLGTLYARFSLAALERPTLRIGSAPVEPGPGAGNVRLLTATGLARDLVTFRDAVQSLLSRNDRVRLLCATEGEAARIGTLLAEAGFGEEDAPLVEVGRLSAGFQVPELRTALLSSDEIFGRTRLPRPRAGRRRRAGATPEWTDLRTGDAVVHLDHGIGIYRGLETIEKDGSSTEHLRVEFAGGTTVYVPVTRAALVHRYVGAGEAKPKLSKLGSTAWDKRRQRVAEAVEGIAAELLRTQALRRARPGIAYPPDAAEQHEFEATFPFDLTADQEVALSAIKADMEADTPSDRLLCGDVGFGKTELAVRAAFKSVMAGRQVAILVPTTVLAEQHGAVFAERFASYPILVEVLSRFRTKGEQRAILERAAEGKVDVVIGTHRLVSGDVAFRELGLLVIDEEQRFGVRAKEALRTVRATVDVLTLTATPIPRTLHMALLGLRDISSLSIAPEGRRAIETRVVTWDDQLVRDAVLREVERGGQVYFIHNRVQTIEQTADKIRRLVPEARVSVVHGQMNDHLVEQRMLDFVEHRVDVLVATTIVESGLDIANANTIFVDRADRLGLADLHQLRGRVGRYHRHAYCYLVVPPGTLPTDAERRVRAVEEYSDLGAGFRIAMRDLEIRGAGNLLGSEQSGHIASVGYELYCSLLAEAVKRIRRERVPFRVACHVSLPVSTAVPREWVPEDRPRIQLFRRLSAARSPEEVDDALTEGRDRFGPPPGSVRRLAGLARVRLHGEALGITRISRIVHDGEERVLLRCVEPHRVRRHLAGLGTQLRVVDRRHCHLLLPAPGLRDDELLEAVLLAFSVGGGKA